MNRDIDVPYTTQEGVSVSELIHGIESIWSTSTCPYVVRVYVCEYVYMHASSSSKYYLSVTVGLFSLTVTL